MKLGGPLVLVALGAAALAAFGGWVGDAQGAASVVQVEAPPPPAPPDAGVDASWRFDERGELVLPPADETPYRCVQPAGIEVPETEGCSAGKGYPDCRWQLPEHDALYTIWRNTTAEHRWARPGLVSLVLATAAEYARRWPGERLVIGDLDAAGPRHQTHDRGVDVDLYLPDAMMTRNAGGRRYPSNYEHASRSQVRAMRARVMDLARILATCADGQIRIYYNDRPLVDDFRAWFEAQGMSSSVGRPMQRHNRLHEFHFHMTVPEEIAPLPSE